jgi:hypothetical protein
VLLSRGKRRFFDYQAKPIEWSARYSLAMQNAEPAEQKLMGCAFRLAKLMELVYYISHDRRVYTTSFRKTAVVMTMMLTCGACVAVADVVINEIHCNPTNNTDWTKFVELYNSGATTVNLGGWAFTKGIKYTFPANTMLAAGTYVIVGQSPSQISNKYHVASMGPFSGSPSGEGDTIQLKDANGNKQNEVAYQVGFPWPTVGENGYSMQLINPLLDNTLGGNWRSALPTPRAQNSVYASTNAVPPAIRQVDHSPKGPMSGETVTITAKVTDPEGVTNVTLKYQLVDPGNYINIDTDAAYSNPANWTSVKMKDDGTSGDAWVNDSVFTAQMPGALQTHRRLVRYKITAVDSRGNSVTVPYADDPQPNFAYFVYDGVPAWTGAVQPGVTANVVYGTNEMRRLPVYHMLMKKSDVWACTWPNQNLTWPTPNAPYYDSDDESNYPWAGTIVYGNDVYDNIHVKAKGGMWRYALGKEHWHICFNRGHYFQAADDWGNKYSTQWHQMALRSTVNLNPQWRGEAEMFEAVTYEMLRAVGVPASYTHWAQFRIIEDASESGDTQYNSGTHPGDFWGLYLAVEEVDSRFLKARNMQDGNIYQYGQAAKHVCAEGPNDGSDWSSFTTNFTFTTPPTPYQWDGWWRSNVDVNCYYSLRTIVDAVHHYDYGYVHWNNLYLYHNPVATSSSTNGLWTLLTYDTHVTWWDDIYNRFDNGGDGFKECGPFTNSASTLNLELKNRVREIQDLMFNTNQACQMINEYAALLYNPSRPSIVDADRAEWDYNPIMTNATYIFNNANYAGQGVWNYPDGSHRSFPGVMDLMLSYVSIRVAENIATNECNAWGPDAAIPNTPVVTSVTPNFYADQLKFQVSAFSDPQGAGTFASMKWRIGEVTDTNSPGYDRTQPYHYEIQPLWESSEISNYNSSVTIPAVTHVGHKYRVRCKMKDNTGRWSHWSAAVEFTAQDSLSGANLVQYLRMTELMYNPADGDKYQFIELYNTSPSVTLGFTGATFTAGIDYTFTNGASIPPNGYLLVVGADSATNFGTFRTYYGLSGGVPIAGPCDGKLAGGGEQLTLKTAAGGTEIVNVNYGGAHWPLAADGAGHSLVPLVTNCQTNGLINYYGSWRASTYIKGSPGAADPAPLATSVVINEIGAHTDYTNTLLPQYNSDDWIELYNTTASQFTFGNNWYLSNDPGELKKWMIPATNVIAGNRWRLFDEISDFHVGATNGTSTNGFGLSKYGDNVLISYLPGVSGQDRVVDCISFDGQERDKSFGRYPDGGNWWILMAITKNAANSLLATQDVMISELMYNPKPTLANPGTNYNDEYVELYNPSANPVALTTPAEGGSWRLNGQAEYTFPTNTVIPAGGYLAVVSFNPTNLVASNAFKSAYSLTNGQARILGPYSGQLDNNMGRVTLERPLGPDLPDDPMGWVVIDEAMYSSESPWPAGTSATGKSLQRNAGWNSGADPASWTAATATPGYGNMLAWKVIQASVIGHGTILPSGSVLVAQNGTTNFIIATNQAWYHIAGVAVDGTNVGAVINYAFTNVTANHTIVASFAADLTASNTPKWWLAQYYPTNNFDFAATNDSDHDGMCAWGEYICGTDPTNPASKFKVLVVKSNGQVMVSYQTIPAGAEYEGKSRYYSMESRTNMLTGAWAGMAGYTNILSIGQSVVYTNLSGPGNSIYYRGRINLR